MDKNLILRSVTGLVYAFSIAFACTPLGSYLLEFIDLNAPQHYLFYGLMCLFLGLCTYECIRVMRFNISFWLLGCVILIGLIFFRYSSRFFHQYLNFQWNTSEALGIILFLLAGICVFKYPKELYENNAKMIFSFVYVGIPFSLVLSFPEFDEYLSSDFTYEVFYVFILIWSSDTFAYIFGRLFGKHLLAPKISPKKTWEGFIGGFVFTVLLGLLLEYYVPGLHGNWIIIGAIIAVFAPFGDLWESQLKRTFGVKDSSQLLPGHGGFLDRLDSFLVCVPFIYLYFMISRLLIFI